jgi:hypothetical protein
MDHLKKINELKKQIEPREYHETIFGAFVVAMEMVEARQADARDMAEALFYVMIENGLKTRDTAMIDGQLVDIATNGSVIIDGEFKSDYSDNVKDFVDNRFDYPR